MYKFMCPDKCCEIDIYPSNIVKNTNYKKSKRKAGVFIYDPIKNKVLLVQSRGNLWGPPKGTIKYGETERECAIRELEEETGIQIGRDCFTKAYNIHYKSYYYYLERDKCDVSFDECLPDNDVNAVGWIKPECLQKCINEGQIVLSKHCKILFKQFLNKKIYDSNFIQVKY
jgi:ADP-ribose pyrophosphatase YjhB (NUDIX family)